MRYLNNLPNVLYSNIIHRVDRTIPIHLGSAYIVPDGNFTHTIDLINDINGGYKYHLAMNMLQSFYTPKLLNFKITRMPINKRLDFKRKQVIVGNTCKSIKNQFNNILNYNRKNIVLDASDFTELVFGKLKRLNVDCVKEVLTKYVDYANMNLGSGYPNKYFLINMDNEKYHVASIASIKENDFRNKYDFFYYFIYSLRYNLKDTLEMFKGYKFIFLSSKGIVKFFIDDIVTDMGMGRYNENNMLQKLLTSVKKITPNFTPDEGDVSPDDEDVFTEEDKKIIEIDSADVAKNEELKKENEIYNTIVDKLDEKDLTSDKINLTLLDQQVKNLASTKDDADKNIVSSIIKDIEENIKSRKSVNKTPFQTKIESSLSKLVIKDKSDNITASPETYDITTVDPTLANNSFINFSNVYNKTKRNQHILDIVKHMSKSKEHPLYPVEVELNDISDEFNYLDELKMVLKDKKGERTTVKVHLPKLINGKYLYIGGNKNVLLHQYISLPIIKIGEDVIITTSYNKVFVSYKNNKYVSKLNSILMKGLDNVNKNKVSDNITFGDNYSSNIGSGETPMEYNIISKSISELSSPNMKMYFKYNKCKELYKDSETETHFCIGEYKEQKILLNKQNGVVQYNEELSGLTLSDFIYEVSKDDIPLLYNALKVIKEESDIVDVASLSDMIVYLSKYEMAELYTEINNIKAASTRLAETNVKILGRYLPMIYILMYTDGLFTILDKLSIDYSVVYKIDVKKEGMRKPKSDKYNQIIVETNDAFLTLNVLTLDIASLLQPILHLDLKAYNIADIERKDLMTVILDQYAESNNIHLYIDNFKDHLIDEITIGVLKDFNLPTNFTDVMLYANHLLAYGKAFRDTDLINTKRLRHAEVINSLLYTALTEKYEEFVMKRKRGSTKDKFTVNHNIVIKEMYELTTVEPYDVLNPLRELNTLSQATFKGHRGVNMDRAYDVDKRSHDQTYYGHVALSSVYNAGVGVNKQMVLDPAIDITTGYLLDKSNDISSLNQKQLLGAAELATPFIINHDDPQRVAMNLSQAGHILPTVTADPVLSTYGFDEVMPYMSDDFAFKAKSDGIIVDVDENNIAVKYVDGTTEVHYLYNTEKNAAKGFYTANDFILKSGLKKGSKVRKNDILSFNKYFFKDINGQVIFTPGPMAWIAIHSSAESYEDSTVISESFSQKIATNIIKKYAVLLNKETIVKMYKRMDDEVEASGNIISYIEPSDDDILNQYLGENISDDLNMKHKISKKHGVINDIRIYYSCELEEMSPSLKKFIKDIDSEATARETILKAHGSKFDLNTKSTRPKFIPPGSKINGSMVDEDKVLVEFYVNGVDVASIGDKVAVYAAMKGIISEVKEDNMMPYAMSSKRRIDLMLRTVSVGARKVYSIFLAGIANKILLNLADELQDNYKDIDI